MLSAQNQRRLATYARRVAQMPRGGLRHRCFFMHVPKCGGTSVSEALYATVPMQRRVGVIDANATRRASAVWHAGRDEPFLYHDDLPTGTEVYAFREQLLLMHMAWDTELIHGHVLFSERAHAHYGKRYRYVTLLREPVERTLSNFLGSSRGGMIDADLDRYLDNEIFRTHGLSMLRYLSGSHPVAIDDERAALERAKSNLARFAVVGFLDDLDGFASRFANTFGRRPATGRRYNRAGVQHPRLTPAQAGRMREVLAIELELWEHARRKYR